MLAASESVSAFVNRHPTVKMLALSFLLLIGMTLVADGAGFHVPKGYIYAAISFSVAVEALKPTHTAAAQGIKRCRNRRHPAGDRTRVRGRCRVLVLSVAGRS
jgi:predicted tellurium resistance membrane protein TerC